MNQFTNTDSGVEAWDFVQRVNSGEVTEVDGREVWNRFGGTRATMWTNGSVSVEVRGRGRNTQGVVWVKTGQTVTFR